MPTYSYTGAVQNYYVPTGVNYLTLDIAGAAGGGTGRGLGARVQATIPVTPGEVLEIRVGGQGGTQTGTNNYRDTNSVAGWNGGGDGGGSDVSNTKYGGGGATDIRRAPYGLADRIIVAGGGGGQAGAGSYGSGTSGLGGHGGQSGNNGVYGGTTWGPNSGTPGLGATQAAGGAGGGYGNYSPSYGNYNGDPGIAGTFGQGGGGGVGWWQGAGGGGGGYYGGGGGGTPGHNGGGGGSSYVIASGTGVIYTTGYKDGNGEIIVDQASGPAPPVYPPTQRDYFDMLSQTLAENPPTSKYWSFELVSRTVGGDIIWPDTFVINSRTYQAIAPVEQWATFDVTAGTVLQSNSSNDLWLNYVLTAILDLIPDPAPVPGGVTIIGTMLDKVTNVYIDGKRTSWRLKSSTEIHALIPADVSSMTVEVYLDYQL